MPHVHWPKRNKTTHKLKKRHWQLCLGAKSSISLCMVDLQQTTTSSASETPTLSAATTEVWPASDLQARKVLVCRWHSESIIPPKDKRATCLRDGDKCDQPQVVFTHLTRKVRTVPTRNSERLETENPDLSSVILKGWPNNREDVPPAVRQYWSYRDELTCLDGLLFKGDKIIVPKTLQSEMLEKIHETHLGIVKCKNRATKSCSGQECLHA